MKYLILTILLFSSARHSVAQIQGGILYGSKLDIINSQNIATANLSSDPSTSISFDNELTHTRGLFLQQKKQNLFGRTEMTYSQYAQRLSSEPTSYNSVLVNVPAEKFQQIDLAFLAGVTRKNTRFGIGPVAHMLMKARNDLDRINAHTRSLGGTAIGFLSSIGIDSGKLHIDLRYENIFRTVGDHIYNGDRSMSIRNKAHTFHMVVAVSL